MSKIEREDMEKILDEALNQVGDALGRAEEVLHLADNESAESEGTRDKNTEKKEKDVSISVTPIVIAADGDTDQGAEEKAHGENHRAKAPGKINAEGNVQISIEKLSGKKRIFAGVVLVILAVYLVLNNLKIIPSVPVIPAIVTFVCLYVLWRGVMRKSFFLVIMPLAVIGCVFDEQLGITAITPWILLGAAGLLSGGLALLFSKDHLKHVSGIVELHDKRTGKKLDLSDSGTTRGESEDGNEIRIENNFNSATQYVESENFSRVSVENNMGGCNVYFSNRRPAVENALISVENNMGCTRLYIPADWHLVISNQNAMGSLKLHGDYNHDETAPRVRLHVESNMGRVDVFFE